MLDRRSDPINF